MRRFLGLFCAIIVVGGVVTFLWAFPLSRDYSFSLLGENFTRLGRKDLRPLLEILEKRWQEEPLELKVGEQSFLVDTRKLGITWNHARIRSAILRGAKEIPLALSFDEAKIQKLLQEVAQKTALSPQNAFFKDRRFIRSREGRILNVEQSALELKEKLAGGAKTVELTRFTPIAPQKDTAQLLAEKGFPYLLARYATSLEDRDEDVIFNIKKAAAAVDGMLIEKGAVFSFNQVSGFHHPLQRSLDYRSTNSGAPSPLRLFSDHLLRSARQRRRGKLRSQRPAVPFSRRTGGHLRLRFFP